MKKLLSTLKKVDKTLNTVCHAFRKTFIGKIIAFLVIGALTAAIAASATYWAISSYHKSNAVLEDNKALNQIYISVSADYMNDLFGNPYSTFIDSNGFTNNFYLLNKCILRTVIDENHVIAFFITSTDKHTDTPIDSYDSNERFLGEFTYSDVTLPNPDIAVNVNAHKGEAYYAEIQGTGSHGMYNYYVYGYLPYGFADDYCRELMNQVAFHGKSSALVSQFRAKAKPNTFGVIGNEYKDNIEILPLGEQWINVYHLVVEKQK